MIHARTAPGRLVTYLPATESLSAGPVYPTSEEAALAKAHLVCGRPYRVEKIHGDLPMYRTVGLRELPGLFFHASELVIIEVAILMGSLTDARTMAGAAAALTDLRIPYVMRVTSAHRTPDRVHEETTTCEKEGIKIIIAGAGGAAHLPGMLAANTHLVVIGVPCPSTLNFDSIFSILQMPRGVPVGTMALGGAGAYNAGIYAAQCLGLVYPEIAERVRKFKEGLANIPYEISIADINDYVALYRESLRKK